MFSEGCRDGERIWRLKATTMKFLPSRFLLSAVLAAGAFLSPARADNAAPAAPPLPAAPAASAAPGPDRPEPRLSIDFPGGSLGDLIALVEKTNNDVSLNVIGEKGALATEIQPFTVKNAYRDGILRAIGALLRDKGIRIEQVDRGIFIVSTDGAKDRRPAHLSPDEVLAVRRTQTIFDSFQLGSYLDDQQSVDNIVDVIRTAWTLNPAHDVNALQIKFHPATKLLLVSGPPDAIEMTRQVIRSLHENRMPRKGPPPPFDNK